MFPTDIRSIILKQCIFISACDPHCRSCSYGATLAKTTCAVNHCNGGYTLNTTSGLCEGCYFCTVK